MSVFRNIAEQRIRDAMERGDFDGLSGHGEALVLDDDSLVPAEMRLAYRVLKNAGYAPEGVVLRREIAQIETLLHEVDSPHRHARAVRKLELLRHKLAAAGTERRMDLDEHYVRKLIDALDTE